MYGFDENPILRKKKKKISKGRYVTTVSPFAYIRVERRFPNFCQVSVVTYVLRDLSILFFEFFLFLLFFGCLSVNRWTTTQSGCAA